MNHCVLFVDGENFLHKVREVFKEEKVDEARVDLSRIDLNKLFKDPLKGFSITRKIFYVSRLHLHPETKKKSQELIRFQRLLRKS